MKYLSRLALLSVLFFSAHSNAAIYYYEATNVTGLATTTYGIGANVNDAPVFSFNGTSGSVSHNLGGFTAGNYTLSFLLEGLEIDINNDSIVDFYQSDFGPDPFSVTSASFYLASLPPLVGNSGPLSWAFNPYSGGSISYDFDVIPGPNSNANVNAGLAQLDHNFSNAANGVMDAVISWDVLRVQLTAVPEPSIFALFGLGFLGLIAVKRRKLKH